MENRLPVLKGTHIPKNIFQNFAGHIGILPHPVAAVGVGADGDDLAAQFLKPAEVILRRQETAAAIHAASVQLQALALVRQGAQDFIDDLLVLAVGNGAGDGIGRAFGDVGQMGQHVKAVVGPDTGQGLLQIPPLRLEDGPEP